MQSRIIWESSESKVEIQSAPENQTRAMNEISSFPFSIFHSLLANILI